MFLLTRVRETDKAGLKHATYLCNGKLAMRPELSSSNPDITTSQDQSNATHRRTTTKPSSRKKQKLCPDSPLLYLQMRRDPASPSVLTYLLVLIKGRPASHDIAALSGTPPPSHIAPKPTTHRRRRSVNSLLHYLRLTRREEVDEINFESWLDV